MALVLARKFLVRHPQSFLNWLLFKMLIGMRAFIEFADSVDWMRLVPLALRALVHSVRPTKQPVFTIL
jgi:hypothetical protein